MTETTGYPAGTDSASREAGANQRQPPGQDRYHQAVGTVQTGRPRMFGCTGTRASGSQQDD